MPLSRPTLDQLIERISTDFETRIGGNARDANVKGQKTFEAVLARIYAGGFHSLYGALDFESDQIFPDTADGAELDRIGAIWGTPRNQPTAASGDIRFTGTSGTIPISTQVETSAGSLYTTDGAGTITSGFVDVAITASETGTASELNAGETVTLSTPIAGVDNDAAVLADGISGGADLETDDAYRERLILRIQQPQRYGAPGDYEQWALENSFVTRAFEFPRVYGAGTIEVFAVNDLASPVTLSGGELSTLKDYIVARQQVMVAEDDTFISTPTLVPLNFTITITPDTSAVRSNIDKSLTDFINANNAPGGTILLSQLNEAISLSPGEEDHTIISPVADVVEDYGDMTSMGTITWT